MIKISAPLYQEVLINNIDVFSYVLSYTAPEQLNDDDFDTCEVELSKQITNILTINQYDGVGWTIEIFRGESEATKKRIFIGEVDKIKTTGTGYMFSCITKFYETVRNEVTTSYDINIDIENGYGSEILKSLLRNYTDLDYNNDSIKFSGDIQIKKLIINNSSVYEQIEKLKQWYNFQCYYSFRDKLVYFEPIGQKSSSIVLTIGDNITNVPQWTYSKTRMINELTLRGAEKTVEKTVYYSGTNTDAQSFILPQTPVSMKVYVGSGVYDPLIGNKPSNNDENLKIGGVKGSTSGVYDYEYDNDTKVRAVYFNDTSKGTQPSFTPPAGTNNIEIQYSYRLPIPVVNTRPISINKNGIHKKTHVRTDIKTIEDAESYVNKTLDAFENPFASAVILARDYDTIEVGTKYRVIDNREGINGEFIVSKIKRFFPYKPDEITIGDEDYKVANWEVLTMDRIKRLEEMQGESQDLLLHIFNNQLDISYKRRYLQLDKRDIDGDTIYNNANAVYGTSVWNEDYTNESYTAFLVQGNNMYEEYLYDYDFFDEENSGDVFWDINTKTLYIPPGQSLITKPILINMNYSNLVIDFGDLTDNDNMLIEYNTKENPGIINTDLLVNGDVNSYWWSISSSEDGQHLIAASLMGKLFMSHDCGESWSEVKPAGIGNKYWFSTSMSFNGEYVAAGIDGGRLYLSQDYGVNWAEIQPAGNVDKSWRALALTLHWQNYWNPLRIIAGVNGGRLYKSDDKGVTWSEIQPAGDVDKQWYHAEISRFGNHIVAYHNIDNGPGRLYLSTNAGVDWDEIQPAGDVDKQWLNFSISQNGKNIFVGAWSGRLYLSQDYGTSWTEIQPIGDNSASWRAVSITNTGGELVAGIYGGSIYYSNDLGLTWTDLSINKEWMDVTKVTNNQIYALAYTSRVYKISINLWQEIINDEIIIDEEIEALRIRITNTSEE